jgi:hypothetical protein
MPNFLKLIWVVQTCVVGSQEYPAGAFHRAYRGLDRRGRAERPCDCVGPDQRGAVRGKGVGVVEVHHRGAVIQAAAEVDAQLLDDRARDFGDRNLQHHLIAAPDHDGVDDLVEAADQTGGKIGRLLGFDRARHRTGQHHAVAEAVDLDIGVRHRCLQRGAYAVEVALDGDVIGGDLLARGIEEHDVGLADRGADDVGALRRTDHGVCDLRIGDQHVLDVARQIDHDRFSDAERKEARVQLAVDGNRRRSGAVVAGDNRGQGRIEREREGARK